MIHRHHQHVGLFHKQQQQSTDANYGSSSVPFVDMSMARVTQPKHNSIQFINETDSIIADSNGLIFSTADMTSSMTATGAAAASAIGAGVTVAGVKRPMTSHLMVQSDDSCDSYDDQIDQLVCMSRDSRRPLGGDGPRPGKKTKGRVKIKMEFIENKLRRYTTFSKRKTGIMKKAYELSTLTGTQVMLLVASETGHVYTFATRKLQPMITSDSGKALIQTCLNSPDVGATPTTTTSSSSSSTTSPEHRGAKHETPVVTSSPDDVACTLSDDDLKVEPTLNNITLDQCRNSEQGQVQNGQGHLVRSNNGSLSTCDNDNTYRTSMDNERDVATSADVIRTSTDKQNVSPDVQSLPHPLVYKLPTSNHIFTLPTFKAAGITSNRPGTLIYQTPEGLLLASPTSLVGALGPDGCLLAAPAHQQDIQHCHNGAATQLLLTVSRPLATADYSQDQGKVQSTPTDLRFMGQLDKIKHYPT